MIAIFTAAPPQCHKFVNLHCFYLLTILSEITEKYLHFMLFTLFMYKKTLRFAAKEIN